MQEKNSHIVFLNLGSNLGNRRLNLSRAISGLEKKFGYFELSHTIESEPQGFDSDHKFLNVGMMVRTDKEPQELLKCVQAVESEICEVSHRKPDGSYNDRIIDIDIIAIDELTIDTEELQIPHPRMHERSFVLEPMIELADGWSHPLFHLTPSQMLAKIQS